MKSKLFVLILILGVLIGMPRNKVGAVNQDSSGRIMRINLEISGSMVRLVVRPSWTVGKILELLKSYAGEGVILGCREGTLDENLTLDSLEIKENEILFFWGKKIRNKNLENLKKFNEYCIHRFNELDGESKKEASRVKDLYYNIMECRKKGKYMREMLTYREQQMQNQPVRKLISDKSVFVPPALGKPNNEPLPIFWEA